MHCRPPDSNFIYIDLNTRIQILDNVGYLAKADKEQCAAFIVRHVLIFGLITFSLSFAARRARSGHLVR